MNIIIIVKTSIIIFYMLYLILIRIMCLNYFHIKFIINLHFPFNYISIRDGNRKIFYRKI